MDKSYYIIESIESNKLNFTDFGFYDFAEVRKSSEGDLFLLKVSSENQSSVLSIPRKWGPFNTEELEYIFLEPTWRRNIHIKT
jgi:hypothetical protein